MTEFIIKFAKLTINIFRHYQKSKQSLFQPLGAMDIADII